MIMDGDEAELAEHAAMMYKAEAFLVDFVRDEYALIAQVVRCAEERGVDYSALCVAVEELAKAAKDDGSRYGVLYLRKGRMKQWMKRHPEFRLTKLPEPSMSDIRIVSARAIKSMPKDPGFVPRVEQLARCAGRK